MNFRTPRFFAFTAFAVFINASISSSVCAEALNIVGENIDRSLALSQYGPTGPADTLWGIAQKVRPDDRVSIYQVMTAIFSNNPHAFNSKNYNSLEKGMILAIPTAKEMRQISVAEAKRLATNKSNSRPKVKTKPVLINPPKTEKSEITKSVESVKQKTINQKAVFETGDIKALKANAVLSMNQIETLQSKNLELTDELARTLDQFEAINIDNKNLKDKIDELMALLSQTEEGLQLNLKNNQALKEDIKFLEMEKKELKAIQEVKPTFFTNPWVISSAGFLLTTGLFSILYLISRRKANNENSNNTNHKDSDKGGDNSDPKSPVPVPELASIASNENADSNVTKEEQSEFDQLEPAPDKEERQTSNSTQNNIPKETVGLSSSAADDALSLDSLWDEASTDFIEDLDIDDDNEAQEADAEIRDETSKPLESDIPSDQDEVDDIFNSMGSSSVEEKGSEGTDSSNTSTEENNTSSDKHEDNSNIDDVKDLLEQDSNDDLAIVEESHEGNSNSDEILNDPDLNDLTLNDQEYDSEISLVDDIKITASNEHELTRYQGEDGYIDIGLLLKEAEEADDDEDNYQQPEPHFDELNDDFDSKVMIDVDDAENSISAKLDLARAYIEIEDKSNAKVLLENVIIDGNEHQQLEAKRLLENMNIQYSFT